MNIANWGGKSWGISHNQVVAIKDLTFAYEQKTDTNNSAEGGSNPTNERGMQPFNLKFNSVLHSATGVDVRKEINEWQSLVNKTDYFILSGEKLGPLLQLKKVSFSAIQLDNIGRLLSATIAFDFREYSEGEGDNHISSSSAINVGNENKKAENTQLASAETFYISIGSYIQIIGSKFISGEIISDDVKQKSYVVSRIEGEKVLIGNINKWVYKNEITLM